MGAEPKPPVVTQWLRADAGAPRLVTHKVRVDVIAGPNAGRRVEAAGPEVRVGSAEGCDLVLHDPTVSRHHLTFVVDGERLLVRDERSTNGTQVDGLCVREAYARPDSMIGVGGTVLRLAMLPELVEIPLSRSDRFGGLLGRSVVMRRLFALLERVARTDTTVLVEGETGTGKELVAEALHEASPRSGGPFVVFDCSAVSPSLVESELFGHVRGSFTGAVADRAGAFEAADGGTLFFDELGELPLDLQPKLLRALEKREVRRVGSNTVKKVDVRVVAATNRSLQKEVERGRFREDLYHRVAVVHVQLPPLRERQDDIEMLVAHFARELGAGPEALPPGFLENVAGHALKGNVRELRNLVARALSLRAPVAANSVAPLMTVPDATSVGVSAPAGGSPIDLSQPLRIGRERLLDAFERDYILAALAHTGGNVSKAAELAGVNRKFIQRAMARLGMRSPSTD